MGEWTLFSNHGHVLVCLSNNHQARLRDVAAEVGITERAVQNILRELQSSGMVQVSKHGRCNHYQINTRKSLRHPLEAHCTVGKLLQLLKSEAHEDNASGHRDSDVAPERPSRPDKSRSISKPDTAPVANVADSVKDETPVKSAQQPVKKLAEAAPAKKEAIQPEKKASKEEKKNKPASNEQGSLF